MSRTTVARSLPPRAALLGGAAIAAAIWALSSYSVLFRGVEWGFSDKTPQSAAVYLLVVGVVGVAWVSARIRTATMVGAMAGALVGFSLGFIFLMALGATGPLTNMLVVLVLLIGATLGVAGGGGGVAIIGAFMRRFTPQPDARATPPAPALWSLSGDGHAGRAARDARATPPAPALWRGAVFLYVVCIPPLLEFGFWLVSGLPFLLLSGALVVGWALWSGVHGQSPWLAVAPLIALVLLAGCYGIFLLAPQLPVFRVAY